jgi:hypothetical protein
MSKVTLQQIYLWALAESDRLDVWQSNSHAHQCAQGAVRLVDACLSDPTILDRLKAAAAHREAALKKPETEEALA